MLSRTVERPARVAPGLVMLLLVIVLGLLGLGAIVASIVEAEGSGGVTGWTWAGLVGAILLAGISALLALGLFTVLGRDEADLERRYAVMAERLPAGVAGKMPLETLRRECLAGTPEQALERLGRFAELGVEELIVSPAPIWFALPDPSTLDLVAETIIPAARGL